MQQSRTITGGIVSAATKAGRVKGVLGAVTLASIFAVGAYVFWMRSLPAPVPAPTPVQADAEAQTSRPADGAGSSLLGDALLIGTLRGTDDARALAPPPIIFMVGRRESDGVPDLSTPAQAVHSALELLGRGDADALSQCFCDGTPDASEGLYPRYLGPPVEVVEVAEERDTARVYWNATVHTRFTLEGKKRSPGETVRLETSLVHIDGVWKLAQLHEDSP
ncbi:MAG: hypothetical protein M1376_20375 [Planctomycetes bacterium]|nr:hypothetical protein [Planctomycetota bacterium]